MNEPTNAQKFVARGLAMKRRGRPIVIIPDDEFSFIARPVFPKHYGKSASNPGRYCKNNFCRSFVPDKDAPCRECGSLL